MFLGSTGYHAAGAVVDRIVDGPLQDRGDVGAQLTDPRVVHHIRLCKVWADKPSENGGVRGADERSLNDLCRTEKLR